jgi:hypothetical protein
VTLSASSTVNQKSLNKAVFNGESEQLTPKILTITMTSVSANTASFSVLASGPQGTDVFYSVDYDGAVKKIEKEQILG